MAARQQVKRSGKPVVVTADLRAVFPELTEVPRPYAISRVMPTCGVQESFTGLVRHRARGGLGRVIGVSSVLHPWRTTGDDGSG
jgi:hypothetical protein